jgi:hypothetical protein
MKIIKKITFSLAVLLAIYSCDTEYDKEVILNDDLTTITGEITTTATTFSGGISIPFSFTVPQSFSKKAIVTVKAENAEDVITTVTVILDAGQTSGSGMIELPELSGGLLSFDAVEQIGLLKIEGLSLVDEVDNDGTIELVPSSDDTTVLNSNEIVLSYFNQLADDGAGDTALHYLVDWDPATIDVDIQVIDRAFTNIFESSGSGDRYESDYFNDFHPDGEYDMYARIYGVVDPTTTEPIPFKIFTHNSDGSRELLEGEIPAGSATGGSRIPIAAISKSNGNTFSIVLY